MLSRRAWRDLRTAVILLVGISGMVWLIAVSERSDEARCARTLYAAHTPADSVIIRGVYRGICRRLP
jgi:hypothetical protein